MRPLERVLVDEDLADARIELRLAHPRAASTPGASTSPGTATTSSSPHDERPRLALGARDLRVDEHVLDLLAAPASRSPGRHGSYLKAWVVESHCQSTAPQRDRAALERDRSYSRTALMLRLPGRQLGALRLERRSRASPPAARQRGARRRAGGGSHAQPGGDVAERRGSRPDRPRSVSGFEESARNSRPVARAVGVSVSSRQSAAAGGRRRPRGCGLIPRVEPLDDEPVEEVSTWSDGGVAVARRPIGRDRRSGGRGARPRSRPGRGVDDLRAERLGQKRGVRVRLVAPQPVVHVHAATR